MSDYKLEYALKQQTPIIHFQYDQPGATLRATEVKPKLDRFIITKYNKKINETWYIGKTNALNYKMRIVAENNETINIGFNTDYDIYYGNIGKDTREAIISENITLTIICMIPELKEIIKENILEFFIVTNFGTMQNKGFGSYIVDTKEKLKDVEIANALCHYYGSKKCYRFYGGSAPFKSIKTIYSIMKSGVNFPVHEGSLLFKYMYKNEIGHEKAQLKEDKLVPDIGKKSHDTKKTKLEKKYVRALLGVANHLEFITGFYTDKNSGKKKPNTKKVIVNIKNGEIERLESSIFFKIINGNVYYVAKRINDVIYDKEFTFTSIGTRDFNPQKKDIKLKVPKKDELPENFIDDFLEYCFNKFNNEKILKKFPDTKKVEITEVKING